MKILHINSYYRGSHFYKNLYDRQMENGMDIDVFVPVPISRKIPDFDFGNYTSISKNHKEYDRLLYINKQNKIIRDIENRYDVSKYSIIHAHSLFTNGFSAMKLKQKYGIPYVLAVRNTDVNTFFKRMIHLRKLGVQILEYADRIIFLSTSYRDKVLEKYVPQKVREKISNKISIIPNGIDDFWFENRDNMRVSVNEKDLKLLYVGVVNRNKNITITIKAIELLHKEGIKAKLTVVGRVQDQSIYNKIKDLEYVEYVEPKPKEKLLQIYRQNHIFVMPSIYESFGLVYAEAMSQGLPVIYSKGQGFDGQFKDGEIGYSVNSRSSEDVAKRMLDIVNNYDAICKRTNICIMKFNWDLISSDVIKMYESIL